MKNIKEFINLKGTDDPNLLEYLERIYPEFEICQGRRVLEIGPFHGNHTRIISHYKPTHITVVEPMVYAHQFLYQWPIDNLEVQTCDIFSYLEKIHNFDVVVCCGVLYHLHSPLWLLELIANKINPTYVVLETFLRFMKNENAHINEEVMGEPGSRVSIENWKPIKLRTALSYEVFVTSMEQLGYQLVNVQDFLPEDFDLKFHKTNTTFTVWKKI
jgi:2-polyprenyl-3-methyl-5-hydroxy-6-metoxy-1,4-benzoquinol methylase